MQRPDRDMGNYDIFRYAPAAERKNRRLRKRTSLPFLLMYGTIWWGICFLILSECLHQKSTAAAEFAGISLVPFFLLILLWKRSREQVIRREAETEEEQFIALTDFDKMMKIRQAGREEGRRGYGAMILCLLLAGICFILYGAIVSFSSILNAEAVSCSDMEMDQLYYIDHLLIMDSYASADNDEDGEEDDLYCLAVFLDGADEYQCISIEITEEDAAWEEVRNYLKDDSQGLGDLVITAYILTDYFDSDSSELASWYQEFCEYYDTLNMKARQVKASYVCAYGENVRVKTILSEGRLLILGLVCFLSGILLKIFTSGRKGREQEEENPYQGYIE